MILNSQHPFIRLSLELAELCKPLELFKIHHFTYFKHFSDGARISLSNKPKWIEDYYNLTLFDSSLFEDKPSLYQPGFNIWLGDYDLDVYRHGKLYYNTSHSITITELQPDGCEFFLFAAAAERYQEINYLANNINILYRFILYLKDKGKHIIKKAEKFKIKHPKQPGSFALFHDLITDEAKFQQMQEAKESFLALTPIHKYSVTNAASGKLKLSRREIECIINLLNNKTNPEISRLMNISLRTVETYMDNIKLKLNCSSRQELIDKLRADKYIAALL